MLRSVAIVFLALIVGCCTKPKDEFATPLPSESRLATIGKSTYFILEPGYQLVLGDDDETLIITVTQDTRRVGEVQTRVVEERELRGGEIKEVSRNFLAIDRETGDVWYFGEEVDNYKDGKIVDHRSSWMAYEDGAKPGILIPGSPYVGMKRYQEQAPGTAMDRFEVVSLSETVSTPIGRIANCLKTAETTPLEKGTEYKFYAPNVGPVVDGDLKIKHVATGKAY